MTVIVPLFFLPDVTVISVVCCCLLLMTVFGVGVGVGVGVIVVECCCSYLMYCCCQRLSGNTQMNLCSICIFQGTKAGVVDSMSTTAISGERRTKKPSNRPAIQIYRPPGERHLGTVFISSCYSSFIFFFLFSFLFLFFYFINFFFFFLVAYFMYTFISLINFSFNCNI